MSLRKDETTTVVESATPNMFKSDSTKAKQEGEGVLDTVASYIPGQHQPLDNLQNDKRQGNILGRESMGDQARAAIQPEQDKTTLQSAKDGLDNIVSAITPESHKTTTQSAADALNPNAASNTGGARKEL